MWPEYLLPVHTKAFFLPQLWSGHLLISADFLSSFERSSSFEDAMIILAMLILVLATRNLHKVQEIREILGNGCRLMTLRDFPGAPEIVENAHTFAGNATK